MILYRHNQLMWYALTETIHLQNDPQPKFVPLTQS